MIKTGIIDYDAGNTASVMKALKFIGAEAVLTRDEKTLKSCDNIIFPGVGAYCDAMNKIERYHLKDILSDIIDSGTPFLGICLGMQLLFESSEETIGCEKETDCINGLSLLKGTIKRFNDIGKLKIPHMGWNSVSLCKDSLLFKDIPNDSYFYFVHSYYLAAEDKGDILTQTEYGLRFDSAVERDNIFGCQFHPEKSGDVGLQLFRNFCNLSKHSMN